MSDKLCLLCTHKKEEDYVWLIVSPEFMIERRAATLQFWFDGRGKINTRSVRHCH